MNAIILALAILPVIILAWYIYKKDKYEKEPFRMLLLAFFLGILAIPLDIFVVAVINAIIPGKTVFYSAFFEAGIPEEFCKWVLFMLVIWRNKNFNEPFDGIVYACFIGLGFAGVENIMYVFGNETVGGALSTGVVRALLSVPGHFLFAVIMGYFLGMAKFRPEKCGKYLILSYLCPMLAHGLFDYLLMLSSAFSENNLEWMGTLLFILFIYLDVKMWKIGVRNIAKMQENSRIEHNNRIFRDIFKS
ncbi:MAG: PrsW family intramembrane metalloprotease [Bacteroidales bacterium]|nr:PrsW family intramembrane metalloprotease [Bacteroidales bacterium]